jgi:hypothetical protein
MRHELFYTYPEQAMDDVAAWGGERMYFRGLGEDAGESVVMMTPSGQAASSQSASTPSAAGGFFDAIGRGLTQLLPVAAQAYSAKKITDINIDRARAGLQPLSPAQYQSMMPAAQVTVGPNEQAKKLMLYGGLAVGGLVLLRALKVI